MVVCGTNSSSFVDVSAREPFSGSLPFEEVPPNNLGSGIGLEEGEGDSKNVGSKYPNKYIGAISAKKVGLTKDSLIKPSFRRC